MKKVSIREVRLHWPSVEKRLRKDEKLIVTRDKQPVATLSMFRPEDAQDESPRFNAGEHMRKLNAQWADDKKPPPSDAWLRAERKDRWDA